MQTLRELTPQEVAEGKRNINDKELTATQIQALVRKMDSSKQKWKGTPQYEEKLKLENNTLYYNFPSLFQMHMEDRLDSTFFEMLNLKRKLEKGEITYDQASAALGQRLFQRYVPQAVQGQAPTPPAMSYESFYRGQE